MCWLVIFKLQLTARTHLIWTGGADSSSFYSFFGFYSDSVLKVKSAGLYNVRPTTKSEHNTEQTADFLLLYLSATLFPTSSSSSSFSLCSSPLFLSSVLLFSHVPSSFLFLDFSLLYPLLEPFITFPIFPLLLSSPPNSCPHLILPSSPPLLCFFRNHCSCLPPLYFPNLTFAPPTFTFSSPPCQLFSPRLPFPHINKQLVLLSPCFSSLCAFILLFSSSLLFLINSCKVLIVSSHSVTLLPLFSLCPPSTLLLLLVSSPDLKVKVLSWLTPDREFLRSFHLLRSFSLLSSSSHTHTAFCPQWPDSSGFCVITSCFCCHGGVQELFV